MLGIALIATPLGAQTAYINREYQIKAAYLYHLIKYVRWPGTSRLASQETETEPFVVTIVGRNPFGGALQRIAASRRIRGRAIRLAFVENPTEIPDCHIVFVPANTSETFRRSVLRETTGRPILVVGESAGFAEAGGMINFYVEENRVRFEINVGAASRAGLSISAKLLQIGRHVVTRRQPNPEQARWPLPETRRLAHERLLGNVADRRHP